MDAKNFSHTYRLTMCGLKKLASGIFPESWKVLAQRRRQQRKGTEKQYLRKHKKNIWIIFYDWVDIFSYGYIMVGRDHHNFTYKPITLLMIIWSSQSINSTCLGTVLKYSSLIMKRVNALWPSDAVWRHRICSSLNEWIFEWIFISQKFSD